MNLRSRLHNYLHIQTLLRCILEIIFILKNQLCNLFQVKDVIHLERVLILLISM